MTAADLTDDEIEALRLLARAGAVAPRQWMTPAHPFRAKIALDTLDALIDFDYVVSYQLLMDIDGDARKDKFSITPEGVAALASAEAAR